MKDRDKTKAQLLNELVYLRQRVTQLEESESECERKAEEIHRSYQIQSIIKSEYLYDFSIFFTKENLYTLCIRNIPTLVSVVMDELCANL